MSYKVFFFSFRTVICSFGGDFPSQNGCDDWNLNLKRATEVKPCELLRAFEGLSLTLKTHWEQRTLESSSFGLNSLTSPALIFDDPGTNLMLSERFFSRHVFYLVAESIETSQVLSHVDRNQNILDILPNLPSQQGFVVTSVMLLFEVLFRGQHWIDLCRGKCVEFISNRVCCCLLQVVQRTLKINL